MASKFLLLTLMTALFLPALASGLVPPQDSEGQARLAAILTGGFSLADLEAQPSVEIVERGSRKALDNPALDRFFAFHSADWEVRWDARSDRPNLIEGSGIPVLAGRGNKLAATAAGVRDVEARLRSFLAEFPEVLKVGNFDLRLDPASTVNAGEEKQIWFVEFQQYHRGVPVEGAKVYFRINNGNIVQFGADRVAEVRLNVTPKIDRVAALASVLQLAGFKVRDLAEVPNQGTLKIIPALPAGERPAEKFTGAPGRGYRHLLVWEVEFRRTGDPVTYQAKVDAKTGKVVELVDKNYYATVTGGIYPTTNSDPETVRPLPFANVTNGATVVTDAAGSYTYGGGTATSTLNGRYIKMVDTCGAISLSNSSTGDLAFGSSGGTDCTTPGVGGAGNTHASRTGYYHLTNINRKAAGFLAGNAWLNGTLTANMNVNSTCNAFWDGSTVNFYRSGGGCSNTGEIAAVFLHEWGHGMDTNSGGAASDKGTGEAVGDTFAFLETKDACIGKNFQPGISCANCNATCTGVRDMASFATGGSHTIAKPSTVADNNGINCDRYSCPYYQFIFIGAYQGPMGYEGHCESYIASTANWDLAQQLIARWGTTTGWAKMDSIWYKSLTPSKSAYQVASGGKCNPAATVNGCGAANWYTVYLAADDDDGNLSNGTPNGCRIWDAFTAHGIACGSRPVCTQ
ncbi:MAG: PepSY domain-containing protein [Thermoanaerobaculia bacterium]